MDRNLNEQLQKLSRELTQCENELKVNGDTMLDVQYEALTARIEDIQDEIWDIEDALLEHAEHEYEDRTTKGWN